MLSPTGTPTDFSSGAGRAHGRTSPARHCRGCIDETLPKLVVGRLRSTWLLGHLNRRTPLPLLMEQAGLKTVRPLEDLLQHADPLDESLRSQWMRADGEPAT